MTQERLITAYSLALPQHLQQEGLVDMHLLVLILGQSGPKGGGSCGAYSL